MLKNCRCVVQIVALLMVLNATAAAQDKPAPITDQKVYSIGHSFHVFMPGILNEMAQATEIKEHKQVGLSSIGGSRVIQH
jgi:hypothetical protein